MEINVESLKRLPARVVRLDVGSLGSGRVSLVWIAKGLDPSRPKIGGSTVKSSKRVPNFGDFEHLHNEYIHRSRFNADIVSGIIMTCYQQQDTMSLIRMLTPREVLYLESGADNDFA